jgi:hypothetical protein
MKAEKLRETVTETATAHRAQTRQTREKHVGENTEQNSEVLQAY